MTLSMTARCQPLPPALLPHTAPAAAWQALLRSNPELLFWPMLSRRSLQEQPWVWAAHGFPGLSTEQPVIDSTGFDDGLDSLYLAYLQHDLAAVEVPPVQRALANPPWSEGALGNVQVLGARLLGPVSLGLSIIDEQDSPLLTSFEQRDALAKFLRLRAAWLEASLSGLTAETLICFDEPFLDALHSPFLQLQWDDAAVLLEEAFASLRRGRALAPGCHVEWDAILRMPVDVIICPLEEQERVLAAHEPLGEFLQGGGIMAWACVPSDEATLESTTIEGIAQQFDQLLAQAAALRLSDRLLLHHSLLTIDGQLDHLAVSQADRALSLLSDVSALIRSRYALSEEPTNVLPSQS